jgi:SAM-dependent methyltransferase
MNQIKNRDFDMHFYQHRLCSVCGGGGHLIYDQPTESIIGLGNLDYHHLINMCNKCGFVFASPVLNEELINKFYESMSNYEHPESVGVRPEVEIRQIQRQFEIISSRFSNGFSGKALDIGCSTAVLLSRFQEAGWQVLGLDPSDKCIQISKKLNVDVIKGFFSVELLKKEAPFNLVILSHVLEHLVDPNIVIEGIRELLSDDGLLYIEVPNLMKPDNTKCYFGFEHVNFFTPVSLSNLILANGFALDRLATFDNGRDISPYYPVIAMTVKKSSGYIEIIDDRADCSKVIEEYRNAMNKLIQDINTKVAKVMALTAPGKLALWGAGIHSSQLLSETCLAKEHVFCIYDNDPKKTGHTLSGIPIKRFPGTSTEVLSEIDAILISSEASEEQIYLQLKPLEAHGLRIYKLYS